MSALKVVYFTIYHDKGNEFNFYKSTWHAVTDYCPMPEYLKALGHDQCVEAWSELSEQDVIETLKENMKGHGISGILRRY